MNPFRTAIRYLQEHGWTTRTMRNRYDGSVCFVGALFYGWLEEQHQIAPDQYRRLTVERRIELDNEYTALDRKTRDIAYPFITISPIEAWNDRKAKDVDEVIHVMKQCEEEWEIRHATPGA